MLDALTNGYSRLNGQDRPRPIRCAKCKRLDWNEYNPNRIDYVYGIRKKFGYWFVGGLNSGGWRTEETADQFLRLRPSITNMKLVLKPLCFLYKNRYGDPAVVKYVNGKPKTSLDLPTHIDIEKQAGRQLMGDMISKLITPIK